MADACDRAAIPFRVRRRRWYTVGFRSCGAALSRSYLQSHAQCLPPVQRGLGWHLRPDSLRLQPALAHRRSPCRILPDPSRPNYERCLLRGSHPWSLAPFGGQPVVVDQGSVLAYRRESRRILARTRFALPATTCCDARALALWNQAGAVLTRKRPDNAEQERKHYAAPCRRE